MSVCLEDQILGACLLQGKIPHNLTTADFKRHHHKTIFEYLKKIEATGQKINIMSLNDALQKDKMEGIGGGIGYWAALTDNVPGGLDVDDFLIHSVPQLQKLNSVGQISNLNRQPTDAEIEHIKSQIYHEMLEVDDDKPKYKKKLKDDWYMLICELDHDIKNCIKYDYTVGNPVINYSNTTLLQAALTNRLWHYVPMTRVTDQVLKRIVNKVQLSNNDFNRVNNYLEILNSQYKQTIDKDILNRFMNCFSFPDPNAREHYTHIFDKFFTRMHLHLRGTSMVDGGGYYGLMANDIVPVLVGGQGIGKTTLTRWIALADELYIDLGSGQAGTFGNEQTSKMVRGKLLAEIGEMGIMRKSEDVEVVKSFISKDKYEVNVKYVEYSNPLPATVSFIGTSNPEEFLSDSTGNRRFYPINISAIDLNAIANGRELIEQLHCYYYRKAREIEKAKRFEACRINDDTLEFIEQKRNTAMIRYNDYPAILQVVGDDYEDTRIRGDKSHKVCASDIERMLTNAGYRMKITKNGITQAMSDMGYEKKMVKIHGVSVRGYYKTIVKGQDIIEIEPPKMTSYTVPADSTLEDIF